MKHKSDDYTNYNVCVRHNHQRMGTGTGGLENKRTSRDHPNYRIAEIGLNTKKSPGDLKSFLVTQIPMENYQLTLLWKLSNEEEKLKQADHLTQSPGAVEYTDGFSAEG